MRRTTIICGLGVMLSAAAFAQPGRGPGGPCDRTCLEGFVNNYLEAMVAHAPERLQVTEDFKFSENDIDLKLGEALWKTASGLGTYRLYFADPQQQQVGFYGTIRENGRPATFVLRLKLDNRRIAEAESLVLRGAATAQRIEMESPDPVLMETVPVSERLARVELIARTNLYFEAIEQGNGKVAPFHPECARFENGMKTSGTSCSDQLDTKIFDYIQKIYPRRFMVIDEERQLVFGFFMFHHPGDITWTKNADGSRRDMGAAATRPFAVDVAELFRIKDKQIRKIDALMVSFPYGQTNPFLPKK
ncbi:MAG: hypothetical protein ABI811_07680 [Acidobacteriota bacterium]